MSERPFEMNDFLAATVEGLKVRGDARAITVLVEGACYFSHWNSDYGVDDWRLFVALDVPIFYAIPDEDRLVTQTAIAEVGGALFASMPGDALESVVIVPKVAPAAEDWRNEAIRFVKGEGVTNQGRVRSDNIAARQHRGLLFRSQAEITLFEALTRAGLAVAPLPVFVRQGKKRAAEVSDAAAADKAVQELIRFMSKRKESR